VTAREREDQRIIALKLAEPPEWCACDRAAHSPEKRLPARCQSAWLDSFDGIACVSLTLVAKATQPGRAKNTSTAHSSSASRSYAFKLTNWCP
jgi:hypothetical protein